MKKNAFLIAGKHTVEEALKNPRRKVIKVFITEDAKKIINRDNQPKNLFKDVSILYRSRKELDNLSGNQDSMMQFTYKSIYLRFDTGAKTHVFGPK